MFASELLGHMCWFLWLKDSVLSKHWLYVVLFVGLGVVPKISEYMY